MDDVRFNPTYSYKAIYKIPVKDKAIPVTGRGGP
jgi:hypothetical protein